MKRSLKHAAALLLAALLAVSALLPASAAVLEIRSAEERYTYVELFNKSVNRIKWDRPFGLLTYTNGVPKNGITVGDTYGGDEIDDKISRWLIPVLEGLFNNSSNLSQSFVKAIFNGKVNPETKTVLTRGTARNDSVPLYGRSEVSLLSAEKNDYTVFCDFAGNAARPAQIAILFPETELKNAADASISDVFSLPDGTIDPVLVGTGGTPTGSRLPMDLAFSDFRFVNARAAVQFNEKGELAYYGTSVDYKFSFTFYDAMNIVSSLMGFNLYGAIINTINTVYQNIGRENVDPEQVLKERSINVTYRCAVEFSNINWENRNFGDVNGDGTVTAADARAALRHSVGLEVLVNAADLIYTDVNFDGEITAADARSILRMSVSLDPPITEVPDGKRVQIALDDTALPEPEPADSGKPSGWFSDIRVDLTPAEMAQSIFDILNAVRDLEEQIQDAAHGAKEIANGG